MARPSGSEPALPDPDQPAGADLLPRIRHIVVLMMENHSYENYLGTLAGRGDGLPLGPDATPDVTNAGLDGKPVLTHSELAREPHPV